MPGLRRLYAPQRAAVRTDPCGAPILVEGATVEAVREEFRRNGGRCDERGRE